ncbi:MAG TPA: protein kinase [Pyrinomonadaceae bacterium]|jgi:HD superfamily phosphohydrolase/tRNA A-37 threonylcarbamoyl transferase component Bud32
MKNNQLIGQIIDNRYKIIQSLGKGGAGEVFRVQQIGLNVERALKLLSPPEYSEVELNIYNETFKNEIRLLSSLSHQNLTKILDFGEVKIDGTDTVFYVMELANGGDLKENFEFSSSDEALRCFGQILDVLDYLHGRNILHFDIKPANILVHTDPISQKREYKVTDLGVSKIVKPEAEINKQSRTKLREETFVYGTKIYAPPYAQPVINNSKSPIKRSDLQTWLPHFDLYTLGLTMVNTLSKSELTISTFDRQQIRRLIENPKNQSLVLQQLPEDQLRYLIEYILLLLEPELDKFAFRSTREAKEAFERMDPRFSLPLQVPEIISVGSKYLINKSNLTSRLSERTFKIVSHPCFQRLQRLNQLNLVELIYPDARQSRLSHCIETFELAKSVASHLIGDELFRLHIGGHELGLFLCASLLHDIGHYPLAHAVEDLRPEFKDDPKIRPALDMDNAAYFLDLPLLDVPPISELLKQGWGIERDELLDVIGLRKREDYPVSVFLFRQLIDGAIDIDKLAYLSRDSWFTGAAYGRGIDIQALISSLVVLIAPYRFSNGVENIPQIGLLDKGINAAESMILARYHMFSRVYWHHTNRAVMAMIRYVMKRVFEYRRDSEPNFRFQTYLQETINMSDIEVLKMLSNQFDDIQIRENKSIFANPLSGLLDNSRQIYKRLCSFSKHPTDSGIRRCHDFLNKKDKQALEQIRKGCIELLSKLIQKEIHDSHVLIDVPQIDKKRDLIPEIFVKDFRSENGIFPLKDVSRFVGLVSEDFEEQVKKSRVFIHPSLREELRSRNIEGKAARQVEKLVFEFSQDQG